MFTEQPINIPKLTGISEKTIEEHKKLYAGYVKNANTVTKKIAEYQGDEEKTYELGELYRHFSFEYNGMRNHECYFSLLSDGAQALSADSALAQAIEKQWSSFEKYQEAHVAMAATTRGIGWAMLSYDVQTGTLILHWVDEQHLGQLQGTTPVVALDMWEHSYVADYQPSGKKQYILDFMSQMNWSVAETYFVSASRTA